MACELDWIFTVFENVKNLSRLTVSSSFGCYQYCCVRVHNQWFLWILSLSLYHSFIPSWFFFHVQQFLLNAFLPLIKIFASPSICNGQFFLTFLLRFLPPLICLINSLSYLLPPFFLSPSPSLHHLFLLNSPFVIVLLPSPSYYSTACVKP